MPLGYRPSPAWQIVLGSGLFTLLGLGGVTLMKRSAARLATQVACPAETLASPVSCAGGPAYADVNWNVIENGAKQPGPARRNENVDRTEDDEDDDSVKLGAFIWCSMANVAAAGELAARLQDVETGSVYCEALPWEHPASGSPDTWRKARWTESKLRDANRVAPRCG